MTKGVDVSELNHLATDLTKAGVMIGAKVYGVAKGYAEGTEATARSLAPRTAHLPHYPETITSEVTITPTAVVAEAGPEAGGQGSVGHLIEDGTATSGPQPHMGPAHDRNVVLAVAALVKVAGDIL